MKEFQKYFFQTTFTIIFRPEMLKFHPYSILTGDTMAEFVILVNKSKQILYSRVKNCITNRTGNPKLHSCRRRGQFTFPFIFGNGVKFARQLQQQLLLDSCLNLLQTSVWIYKQPWNFFSKYWMSIFFRTCVFYVLLKKYYFPHVPSK